MSNGYDDDVDDTGSNYYSGEYGPTSTIGFEAPWVEQYRRGFFDNLMNLVRQPMPVPQRGVAGLDPFEMQARALSGGLGGFQPYLQQAGGAYGQGLGALGQGTQAGYMGAQAYDPSMGKAFYNPYEDMRCKSRLMTCMRTGHNKTWEVGHKPWVPVRLAAVVDDSWQKNVLNN